MPTKAKPASRRGPAKAGKSPADRLRAGEYSPELAIEAGFTRTVTHERPTTGRVVLFHDAENDAEPEAAIITRGSQQHDGAVSLVILGVDGTRREANVPKLARGVARGWSWPQRVEPHREDVALTEDELAAEFERQEREA